jgi:hypothetical protein
VVSAAAVVSANRDWQYMRLHSRRPVLSMIVDILAGVKVNKNIAQVNVFGWLFQCWLLTSGRHWKVPIAYICNNKNQLELWNH